MEVGSLAEVKDALRASGFFEMGPFPEAVIP
jgi:hypothetical protein